MATDIPWHFCGSNVHIPMIKQSVSEFICKLLINTTSNFYIIKLNKLLTVASLRQHWGLFSFMRWQSVGEVPMYGVIGGNPRTYLKIRKNKYFVLHLIENFNFFSYGTLYINNLILTSKMQFSKLNITVPFYLSQDEALHFSQLKCNWTA